MYLHPAYIDLQIAERFETNRALARPRRIGGGTPLLTRIADVLRAARPTARLTAARPRIGPAPQAQPLG